MLNFAAGYLSSFRQMDRLWDRQSNPNDPFAMGDVRLDASGRHAERITLSAL
jgi:hypothetical protein